MISRTYVDIFSWFYFQLLISRYQDQASCNFYYEGYAPYPTFTPRTNKKHQNCYFFLFPSSSASITGCFVAAYQAKSGNAQWNVLTFWIKSRLDCRFCRNAAVYESARLLLQKICNAQKGRMEDAIEKPANMPLTPAMPQFWKSSIFVRALKSAVLINSSGKTFPFWRRKEQTRSGDKLKPLDLVLHRLQPGNKKNPENYSTARFMAPALAWREDSICGAQEMKRAEATNEKRTSYVVLSSKLQLVV